MSKCCGMKISKNYFYLVSIVLGVLVGLSNIEILHQAGTFCSELFIRIFRFISMPIISLSVIVALSSFGSDKSMSKLWKKTLRYTITTTLLAATLSAVLYLLISPHNMSLTEEAVNQSIEKTDYIKYILNIIPDSLFSAFHEHKVLSVLLISLMLGFSIRFIKDENDRASVISFFKGIHSMFFTITKYVVRILPVGLFGFITVSILELKTSMDLKGMGGYFLVIILANTLQGLVVLPTILYMNKINPIKVFKAFMPALSVAFFSKSSTGALPVTMQIAEEKLQVSPKVSRFVLPLCTTINMNGCAAFIFTTVIYMMQNYGVEISFFTIFSWIIIATIAAIGNAGIPMGCFFLSASLLSSMDIPMPLLGIILPIYGVLDMLETALNVWSDSCVCSIVHESQRNCISAE